MSPSAGNLYWNTQYQENKFLYLVYLSLGEPIIHSDKTPMSLVVIPSGYTLMTAPDGSVIPADQNVTLELISLTQRMNRTGYVLPTTPVSSTFILRPSSDKGYNKEMQTVNVSIYGQEFNLIHPSDTDYRTTSLDRKDCPLLEGID